MQNFLLIFQLWKFITSLWVNIINWNLAGTFENSLIIDPNRKKCKLIIFLEQFYWKTEEQFLVFIFLQLRQSAETTSKILLNINNIKICNFLLVVFTKIKFFWQKIYRNDQPKNSYQLSKFSVNFFHEFWHFSEIIILSMLSLFLDGL
mgnify:CR=1 FL=1